MKSFYKEHYPMIMRLVTQNGGSEDEAKDIYQDGVIALFDKINARSLILNCKLKTYLYSLCRNLWLTQLKKKRINVMQVTEIEEYTILEEPGIDEKEKNLHYSIMTQVMTQIGEPCHSLLHAFYIEEKSMTYIQEAFGYANTDTVKTQRYKCMNRLKKLFFDLKKTNE
ncbi:MAG: sigma-70 family RNA polymerase sigma factor [Bacteroidetes bacterium]|nr:sigma-70 family RNA polymerase sigma factor [Bacteroidota bacterium]